MPSKADMEAKAQARIGQRQAFESSEVGQQRMTGITSEHTGGASLKQYYHHMGVGGSADPNAASIEHHAQQLPGLETGPVHAKVSTAWDRLPEEERGRSLAALRTHAGVDNTEFMKRAYGAQLDQGTLRGLQHGSRPHAADFYEPQSETGRVLRTSARETQTPFHEHTAALAMTSNQTTFKHPTSTIAGGYFNNALARSASVQEQAGVDPSSMKLPIREDKGKIKKVPGLGTSVKRAGAALRDMRRKGSSVSEVEGFGPKTGPFHNAFQNTVPGNAQEEGGPEQRLVGDVHTLGGGFLPHLSSAKSQVMTAKGTMRRDKSEREKAIEQVPHFHELADHLARQVHAERGITNTGIGQATQWGEEQIQRGEAGGGRRGAFPTAAQAYPQSPAHLNAQQFDPSQHQGSMIKQHYGPGSKAERVRSQAIDYEEF